MKESARSGRARSAGRLLILPILVLLFAAAPGRPAAAQDDLCDTQTVIVEDDCWALVDLYFETGGDSWTTNSNWLSGSPCDWFGVTCDDNRVTMLVLTANNLAGPLPDSIGDLTGLTFLHLGGNALSGEIPDSLGDLDNLTYLYLNDNELQGTIPSELGDLDELQFLYLNGSKLGEEVPASLCSVSSLVTTNLAYNRLSTNRTNGCVSAISPSWQMTQTVPPTGLSPRELNPTTAELSWTPIDYSTDSGFYEIFAAESSGGPYTLVGRTPDKTAARYEIADLRPGTSYYFIIRTITLIHDRNKNELVSDDSQEVTLTPTALTLTSFSAAGTAFEGGLILAALALLAATVIIVQRARGTTTRSA